MRPMSGGRPGSRGLLTERDFSRHIAENVAKGSSLCPFGSRQMKDIFGSGRKSAEERAREIADLDLHGFDPDAPDSDDEPLTDLEE